VRVSDLVREEERGKEGERESKTHFQKEYRECKRHWRYKKHYQRFERDI
jgi:hypothetical protein